MKNAFKMHYKILWIYALMHLLTQFGKGRYTEIWRLSFVRAPCSYLQPLWFRATHCQIISKKEELIFHQPGSRRENFSSDSTTRIFFGLSAPVLRIVCESINLGYDISSAPTSTSQFAKSKIRYARETNGKRAGSNRHGDARCRMYFRYSTCSRPTNTHVNYTVHASMHHTCNAITYARVLHNRIRSSGYFVEARRGIRIAKKRSKRTGYNRLWIDMEHPDYRLLNILFIFLFLPKYCLIN